jgi:hypothetical protein
MTSVAIVISLLKFLGVTVSGVLGVLGLTKETRDRTTNELTRWGRWALTGIIVSCVAAGASQAFELVREQQRSIAATKQLERSQAQMDRLLAPLPPTLDVIVELEVPLAQPALAPYVRELKSQLEAHHGQLAVMPNDQALPPLFVSQILTFASTVRLYFDVWGGPTEGMPARSMKMSTERSRTVAPMSNNEDSLANADIVTVNALAGASALHAYFYLRMPATDRAQLSGVRDLDGATISVTLRQNDRDAIQYRPIKLTMFCPPHSNMFEVAAFDEATARDLPSNAHVFTGQIAPPTLESIRRSLHPTRQ